MHKESQLAEKLWPLKIFYCPHLNYCKNGLKLNNIQFNLKYIHVLKLWTYWLFNPVFAAQPSRALAQKLFGVGDLSLNPCKGWQTMYNLY